MPTYGPVVITKLLDPYVVQITKLKKENPGAYERQATKFDSSINRIITTGANLAASYVDASNKFTQQNYEEMKLVYKQVEAIGAKKDVTDRDVEVLTAFKLKIEKASLEAEQDSQALTKVLAGDYRGGWPAKARGILKDPSVCEQLTEARNKEINEGKSVAALRKRLEEWAIRSAEFLKQVTQRSKKGNVAVTEFRAEIDNFLSKMTASKLDVETIAGKTRSSAERIATYAAQKTYSPSDKKSAKELLTTLIATLKNMRGAFKTMTIEFEGFKKRASSAGPGWKEDALKAFKSAKTLYDASEKAVKEAEKREGPSIKAVEKMEKAK